MKGDKKNNICLKAKKVWGFVKSLWLTVVFGLRLLGKIVWIKDKLSVISGGDGVELWSRDLITIKFKLDDFKFVKNFIPFAVCYYILKLLFLILLFFYVFQHFLNFLYFYRLMSKL